MENCHIGQLPTRALPIGQPPTGQLPTNTIAT